MDVLTHNFIRLGQTRAKALQTVSRFPRETRRRFAAPKSNVLTLDPNAENKLKPSLVHHLFAIILSL